MKSRIKKYRVELTGLAVASFIGWCYWYFAGCASGSCTITSNLLNSSIYGVFMAALVFGMFKKKARKNNQQNKNGYEKY